MSYLGISISGKDIYLSLFEDKENVALRIEKFTLSDGFGESLKDFYSYIELYLSKVENLERIIFETASPGPRSHSFERLKVEGILELLLANHSLLAQTVRIKSQKKRKKYNEITNTPVWKQMGNVTYFKKIEQIAAYMCLEEII
ncbi:hypothetical protein J7E63_11075 [Bacillus sp. ISL-75]|uniref:hypothetical protein n=1 Tax=Bacillus sp. ISL-75 TaxID=2819137 RepID=UPI001BEC81E0|nr:hypothetical protein [Bacillus sp. ISL-75]MBT2727476.1 hypothetical protein [Bacillus sp. ISL-75]